MAEARPQRGAGHEEGHDQGDGQLHGVVRQARRQARRRLNLGLVGVGYQVRPVPGLRREGPDVVEPCIFFFAALPRLDVLSLTCTSRNQSVEGGVVDSSRLCAGPHLEICS